MAEKEAPKTIDIHYLKSSDFREIACDGALGGPTPRGKLWLAFFTERLPLPRIVQHQLRQTSTAGEFSIDESKPTTVLEGRGGIIRNVEFGLYLRVDTARQLHEWLGKQIEQAEKSGEDKR